MLLERTPNAITSNHFRRPGNHLNPSISD